MTKKISEKFVEMESFKNVFQSISYDYFHSKTFPLKGKWGKEYFKNDHPIILELGCGKGEYTVGLARLYPEKNYIGMDIKGARIWTGANDALINNLHNVAFIRSHVQMVSHFFETNEISEIWITFPDPQIRKVNRRLTSVRFLKKYNRILKNNGIIHLKTDSNFLYTYTKAVIKKNELNVLFDTEDLHHATIEDDALSIKTFYEKLWLKQNIPIKYIQFRSLKKENWLEPDIEIPQDSYRSFGRNQILKPLKSRKRVTRFPKKL